MLCTTIQNSIYYFEEYKMRHRTFFTVILLATTASICSAGTMSKGIWSPSGCGNEPVLPSINQATVDGYNKSVKTINDWQQKVSIYSGCVVKEANDDNASIAKSANERQTKLQERTEKIHADTEAAKAKLDSK
jgi:hypothetical protein